MTMPPADSGQHETPSGETWDATIWQNVVRRAVTAGDSVLVTDEKGRTFTAGEFLQSAERVAAGLRRLGVGPGSVVSWQLPTTIEAMLIMCALRRLDAVQNPLTTMLREHDVEFIVRQAQSTLLIVARASGGYDHAAMAERISDRVTGLTTLVLNGELPDGEPDELPPPEKGDPAAVRWLYYTSGTTAQPKGARHRDADLLAATATFCNAFHPTPSDTVASVAPIAHIGGLLFILGTVVSGARLVITERFSPEGTARQLGTAGVTLCCCGVPFLHGFLDVQRKDPSTRLFPDVRAFLIGGSTRTPALHETALNELGAVVVSGYGATEVPLISWGRPDDDAYHLSVADGRPAPDLDFKIVRADGSIAAVGEPGEPRIKGHSLMAGYVDSSLDEAAFDEEGYFRTGDLGYLDEDGYLIITGRIKDVIIRNMENISAREVELALIRHPEVGQVAVIGLPDERTGERVCAVIVPTHVAAPPSLEELTVFLLEGGLNPRKLPTQIEVLDSLPMNSLGKLQKQDLRQTVQARAELRTQEMAHP